MGFYKQLKIAKSIGFKGNTKSEGTYRKFVNVDEDWINSSLFKNAQIRLWALF